MLARELRLGSGLALLLLAAASTALVTGCPSLTCEDTATCAEPATGGSSSGGIALADGAVIAADGALFAAEDTDGATSAEGEPGADGATTLPDSTTSLPDGTATADTSMCQANENCANGIDDDCNGMVDCADPACQEGFSCVEATPTGWSGPGIFVASSSTSLPTCPAAYAVDAVDGVNDPSAPPAVCGCACGGPSGITCTPTVSFYYDSSCNNLCEAESLSLNACVASCAGAQTLSLDVAVGAGGSCAPQPSAQVPTATWGSTARVCASATAIGTGGCSGGQVCVAKPPSPFSGATCFWQSGTVSCPDPSETQYVYFSSSTAGDSRGCTGCTCGAPQGVTCGGASITTFSTFSDGACDGDAGVITEDNACVDAPASAHGVIATSTGTTAAGSCAPSGGSATGSFTPSGATTICCVQ